MTVDARKTNNRADRYHVSIYAKRNRVAGWSCETRDDAEATAGEWLAAHPEHARYTITEGTLSEIMAAARHH
jgi:hypothetical protein